MFQFVKAGTTPTFESVSKSTKGTLATPEKASPSWRKSKAVRVSSPTAKTLSPQSAGKSRKSLAFGGLSSAIPVSSTQKEDEMLSIYKGIRFQHDALLDVRTHFKPTETFQYTHFSSSHPPGVKKGFIKGEALRLLRTNSSKELFEEKIKNFKSHLIERGYPENLIITTLSEVIFEDRKLALQKKTKGK